MQKIKKKNVTTRYNELAYFLFSSKTIFFERKRHKGYSMGPETYHRLQKIMIGVSVIEITKIKS